MPDESQLLPLVGVTVLFGLGAAVATHWLCANAQVHGAFIKAGLSGRDLHKRGRPVVPESFGVLCGLVYLVTVFLYMPIPFLPSMDPSSTSSTSRTAITSYFSLSTFHHKSVHFPYPQFAAYLSALLSLCAMVFLGFADDVLELRWRVKLWLPTIACVPLLAVYYVTYGQTEVVVPMLMRGMFGRLLDIGLLYYVYMGMLAVFCTNAINIMAGINGLEVGQSLVIGITILANDLLYMFPHTLGAYIADKNSLVEAAVSTHKFSFYLVVPFVAVSGALYVHNRYPARAFVGDTYCYFAGMTFAVVGILGHYSKTLLLFFIPQIFNFLYSLPQLVRAVPCPRHRLPSYDAETDTLSASMVRLFDEAESDKRPTVKHYLAVIVLRIFELVRIVKLGSVDATLTPATTTLTPRTTKRRSLSRSSSRQAVSTTAQNTTTRTLRSLYTWHGRTHTHVNNLNLINLVLVIAGPMHERTLCHVMLAIQVVFGSVLAFTVRYGLVNLFF